MKGTDKLHGIDDNFFITGEENNVVGENSQRT